MRWRRSEPDWRFFKQLEFSFSPQRVVARFEGGTRSPSALIINGGKAASLSKSSSERPIHLKGRDHMLETQARALLRELGANELAREIRVEWNPRLKTCAGRADYREKLISLNPLLRDPEIRLTPNAVVGQPLRLPLSQSAGGAPALQSEISEVDRTLRHELAHLLAQFRVGRRRIAPHGAEWRKACVDLGIADETRCHNLPFATKSRMPRYIYVCPNCKEKFPRVRRIRRAIACLACCRKHNRGDFDPRFRLKLVDRAVPAR